MFSKAYRLFLKTIIVTNFITPDSREKRCGVSGGTEPAIKVIKTRLKIQIESHFDFQKPLTKSCLTRPALLHICTRQENNQQPCIDSLF